MEFGRGINLPVFSLISADQVCRFANLLKSLDVRKGDIVTIYLPMIPEIVYAMLACARIGAVHRFTVYTGTKRVVDTMRAVHCKMRRCKDT